MPTPVILRQGFAAQHAPYPPVMGVPGEPLPNPSPGRSSVARKGEAEVPPFPRSLRVPGRGGQARNETGGEVRG